MTKKINEKIYKVFARWSENINEMYCIHWILLGFSMLVLEVESYNPPMIIFMSIILFIVSDFISTKFTLMNKMRREKVKS